MMKKHSQVMDSTLFYAKNLKLDGTVWYCSYSWNIQKVIQKDELPRFSLAWKYYIQIYTATHFPLDNVMQDE